MGWQTPNCVQCQIEMEEGLPFTELPSDRPTKWHRGLPKGPKKVLGGFAEVPGSIIVETDKVLALTPRLKAYCWSLIQAPAAATVFPSVLARSHFALKDSSSRTT